MKLIKCKLCNAEISDEKCMFVAHKKVIDSEEHYFCCERHADEFERKGREQK